MFAGAINFVENVKSAGYYKAIANAEKDKKKGRAMKEQIQEWAKDRQRVYQGRFSKAPDLEWNRDGSISLVYRDEWGNEVEWDEHGRRKRKRDGTAVASSSSRQDDLLAYVEEQRKKKPKYDFSENRRAALKRRREWLAEQEAKRKRDAEDAELAAQHDLWEDLGGPANNIPDPTAAPVMPFTANARTSRYQARNKLDQFKGNRVGTNVLVNRRAHKEASMAAAIQRWWRGRMPLLTLRTYSPKPWPMAAVSASQAIFPQAGPLTFNANGTQYNNYTFPTKRWIYQLYEKMVKDMVVPSGNTPGDGIVVLPVDTLSAEAATNTIRHGISILNITRSYRFMNTTNAVAFLEAYEFVWKGTGDMEWESTAASLVNYCIPAQFWQNDLLADNPVWGTTVAWPANRNTTITTPGARPDGYCKHLYKHYRLEKKTKYILAAGNTITHTINIPAMYFEPDEFTGYATLNASQDVYGDQLIPGKTRCIMFILHGQLGFDGGATNTYRVENIPVSLNAAYRQLTTCRIQEHGQKIHTMWTGADDFTSNVDEHVTLTNPHMLVMDPADVVTSIGNQDA